MNFSEAVAALAQINIAQNALIAAQASAIAALTARVQTLEEAAGGALPDDVVAQITAAQTGEPAPPAGDGGGVVVPDINP